MNFFRRFLCLGCLPKRKPRVHRDHSGTTDKHHLQVDDLEKVTSKIQRDLGDLVAKKQHSLAAKAKKILPKLDEKGELVQGDLDELRTRIRNDLNETAARIRLDLHEAAAWVRRDLGETVTWIRRDLDATAAWIRLELKKLESHIQNDLEVTADKIQHDLEETSIRAQRDLKDFIAQRQFSLEVKTEEIQPPLEVQDELACDDVIYYEISVPIQRELEFNQEETADQYRLDEDWDANYQSEWEETAVLIKSDRGMKPTTQHYELWENTSFHNEMSLENFVLHKVLGKGTFGKVMLAELKGSGKLCAIKALNKASLVASGYSRYLMAEKRVLMMATECPFLAHMHSTFQTKDHLFFVMEYISGGDLFFHIEKRRRFDLVTSQFYAAEMTCGIQFLHSNGVISRDVKLDNVMLDGDGHIKIVDFGLSKENMLGDARAESLCGSEHYIAPEIYQGKPYFSPVDWWSFGVLLFEMLTGNSPFYGADGDELVMSICMDTPEYPTWLNMESKDILEKLLEKDPNHRLGTFGNIRGHPFFESIDWPKLERRELEPPFKPKLVDHNDFSYFPEEFLNETPKMSQGDSSYIGPMDQSEFIDFSYVNSKFWSTG